MKKKVLEL